MATIIGTLGDDFQIIDLNNADDTIYGDSLGLLNVAGGDDRIFARTGNDQIAGDAARIGPAGGGGNDLILGGDDDDDAYGDAFGSLFGTGGRDTIYQNAGVGILVGDATVLESGATGGNDRLYGTGTLIGDAFDTTGAVCGNDYLDAALAIAGSQLFGDMQGDLDGNSVGGRDGLRGSEFDDLLVGDGQSVDDDAVAGSDRLVGLGGADGLYGDAEVSIFETAVGGDDDLHGRAGNDVIFGDAPELFDFAAGGDDLIYGGAGDDELWGDGVLVDDTAAGGSDTFYFGGAFGDDTVNDFRQGEDTLVFRWGLRATEFQLTVDGGDTVLTTFGDDSVRLVGFTDPLTIGVDIIFA